MRDLHFVLPKRAVCVATNTRHAPAVQFCATHDGKQLAFYVLSNQTIRNASVRVREYPITHLLPKVLKHVFEQIVG